jgi:hypothetical protein
MLQVRVEERKRSAANSALLQAIWVATGRLIVPDHSVPLRARLLIHARLCMQGRLA